MRARSTPLAEKRRGKRTGRDIAEHRLSASPSDTPTLSQASLQTSPGTGLGAEHRPGPRAEPGGERMWLIMLAGLLQCVSAYDIDLKKLDGLARARVEVE